MDSIDRRIIAALASNARISLKELSATVGLASPSVAERLKRLREQGQIAGFTVAINPRSLGYAFQAIVRLNPVPGALEAVEKLIVATPEVIECDRVTGEDCFIARLCLSSIDALDVILKPFHKRAHTVTSIVKSQPVLRRLPPLNPHETQSRQPRITHGTR